MEEERWRSGQEHLVVAADTWQPWFLITEGEEGKDTTAYSGIMWEVLLHLSSAMNFTYILIRPPDGKWGTRTANGSWNGMVGMLQRREVDMALGPFGITQARSEVCEFSYPLVVDSWSILMAAPDINADPWVVARPFDRFTWLALALTGTVVLMVFFLGRHSHFDKICGFLVRGLFSQSAHWIPSQMSYQRILSVAWVTLIFFLAQFYSGTLVSMFAVPSLHIEVNSLADLVGQSDLPWAIEGGSILVDIGKASSQGTALRKLHDGSLPYAGLCASNTKRIKTGEFAQICALLDIYSILSEDFGKTASCNLFFAQDAFLPVNFALAVQVGCPFLHHLNKEVMSLLEAGLPNQWLNALLPNKTQCGSLSAIREAKTAEHAGKMSLDLVEMEVIFAIVGLLLATAIIGFVLEAAISSYVKTISNSCVHITFRRCANN